MGENMQGEHCVLCGSGAAVRVRGTSFCAPCGLEHYSAGRPELKVKRRTRAAFFGLLSSGLVVKVLLGAVAVAAVGGVATSAVRTNTAEVSIEPPVALQVTSTVAPQDTTAISPSPTALPASSDVDILPTRTTVPSPVAAAGLKEAAYNYAAAVQAWADCVSMKASAHSGGPFDPHTACGDKPLAGTYGLGGPDDTVPPGHDPGGPGNSENAPGHDPGGPGNSENAPGQSEEGPGNSGNAPGQSEEGPGNSGNAPGREKDG